MAAAVPEDGMSMLTIVKSGLRVSLMTIFVAPGLEMLAARSANKSSSSESSGVTAT